MSAVAYVRGGARMHLVRNEPAPRHQAQVTEPRMFVTSILKDESCLLVDAVRVGFPDRELEDLGSRFSPNEHAAPITRKLALVNFGMVYGLGPVLRWGQEKKIALASPRAVCALGAQEPELHRLLLQEELLVVAPQDCNYCGNPHVLYGYWKGRTREAHVIWAGSRFDSNCWFAFYL